MSKREPLSVTHPEIAAEWHPTKNGDLTPEDIGAGSHRKVWWKCPEAPDHEYLALAYSRTGSRTGCPFCAGKKVSVTNSLAAQFPEIAAQWHPTKNGELTPEDVVAGSNKKVWWQCPEAPDHEWQVRVVRRTRRGDGCPYCSGRRASVTNSLATQFPEIAAQWHPTSNDELTPEGVAAGSHRKVWWKCPEAPDHEWQATVKDRTSGRGCPFCRGLKVSPTNSLASLFPEIAAQWHPTKNSELTPERVVAGSHKKVWWKCPEGPDHGWLASVANRTRLGRGCPRCAGKKASTTNSLATQFPEIAAQWHPTKNEDLTPDRVVAGSGKRVWWKCSKGPDHEWLASLDSRTGSGTDCPFCDGKKVSVTNSLASLFPEIAAEWHQEKNGDLTPEDVVTGSGKKVWWKCPEGPDHGWLASVANRTRLGSGCPRCAGKWPVASVRAYVASIRDYLGNLNPAELYVLFQQSGLMGPSVKVRGFVSALATGRFPTDELDKFIADEPSSVDRFIEDVDLTLAHLTEEEVAEGLVLQSQDVPGDQDTDAALPIVETKNALATLDGVVPTSADAEAVEFLTASATAKMWRDAFVNPSRAVRQAEEFSGGEYACGVRDAFLEQYRAASALQSPPGYKFEVDGLPTEPNLMQRLAAVRVRDARRVGNWSGTGAGKTLSAVLASRVIGAQTTVITCPNSVVDGWREAILAIYPQSQVATKDFEPEFDPTSDWPRYLIFNYEAFQQPDSHRRVRALVDAHDMDFVVVDEIHFTKQREVENMSRRRQMVTALVQVAAEKNPNLAVLGMSATPVINNLQEGRSLIELVTGVEHSDLNTRTTVSNCMKVHQHLVRLGLRWMPEYDMIEDEIVVDVDCSDVLDEIRAHSKAKGTPLSLEQILTRARLPTILEHVKRGTLIYTHYVQGIDRILREALEEAGWKTGFFTGDDKSGLEGFLRGDVDVLIGSSAIGTGVDGLQNVCDRLIINVLPWTAAEYEQLKGRIYRQGQKSERVQIIIPVTFAEVNGERWSWCDSKRDRLKFKKSVADAAVDGVVPEGHIRSPAQAYQDVMTWLERLDSGEVEVVHRVPITVPLPTEDEGAVKKRQARYGDFSRLNNSWNGRASTKTHEALQANPEEWAHYHTLYREARETWTVVPYGEMIRWLEDREGLVVGDFGCGEAKIAEAVEDRHVVYSFDHVAINDEVTACDVASVPLDDETLDVAVFGLSLMGSNFTDYLREAHRTLKIDGQIHLFESTSRFTDLDAFVDGLKQLGFDQFAVEDRWKFTYIRALKARREPREDVTIRF